jgi:hypothetical protein
LHSLLTIVLQAYYAGKEFYEAGFCFYSRPERLVFCFNFYETGVPCPTAIDKFFCGQAEVRAGIACCVTHLCVLNFTQHYE